MKKLWCIAFLLILSPCVFSQQPSFTIGGTVMDSVTGHAIELATVILKTSENEKVVSGATTGLDGKFLLTQCAPGNYLLAVSFTGYASRKIPIVVNSDMDVGKVILQPASETLHEAVVVAEKSLITKNAEKTVVNVARSPTGQTGTAEDVLRNLPGVSVDQNGSISITGKQGVKVLVDGRPNAMAQNDLQSFLKSVPANSIEAVEIITNPSARYTAEGNVGIINIKLKKKTSDGLNGLLSAAYGILNRYNGNAAINYRRNKVNFFANYSINASKIGNWFKEDRTILMNDTTSYYNVDTRGTESRINNSLKAGIDYFVNDKNALTYTVGGNYSTSKVTGLAKAKNLDAFMNEAASYNSVRDERISNYFITNDLAWKRKFDSTGHELDVNLNYTYVNSSNNSTLNSEAYDSAGIYSAANSLKRRTLSGTDIHSTAVQLDYVFPFKKLKGYKFETGALDETTIKRNTFDAYRTINNTELPDTLLNNNFKYTENIAALYGILSGGYKTWLSWSAGLRAEHTYIRSNNNSVNKNYVSFFPSASINFAPNDVHNFSVSYSRRIQRPQFRQINNAISYLDPYSTWQGNSLLQPAFSHIVSVNYTVTVKQHMFSFEAGGNFKNNGFVESSSVDSTRINRSGVTNGADSRIFNFTFYSKLQITRWLDLQMSHSYIFSHYGFKPGLNTASASGSSYALWASISARFWKNAVFEINGWFNSGGVQPQGKTFPIGQLNASIRKSFFKDRFTVSVAGQNLLNSMKWRWTVNNNNLLTQGSWQNFDRCVTFTLTYRFGKNNASFGSKVKKTNRGLGRLTGSSDKEEESSIAPVAETPVETSAQTTKVDADGKNHAIDSSALSAVEPDTTALKNTDTVQPAAKNSMAVTEPKNSVSHVQTSIDDSITGKTTPGKVKSEVAYKIQFGAVKGPWKDFDKLSQWFNELSTETLPNGIIRYYASSAKSYAAAKRNLEIAISHGYTSAFIVQVKDGRRIVP